MDIRFLSGLFTRLRRHRTPAPPQKTEIQRQLTDIICWDRNTPETIEQTRVRDMLDHVRKTEGQ